MAEEGFKRKLTAILSADVEGYSRLMGEDEDATIRTLTAYRELMTTLIEKHRGRVVDSPGDNLLAEFLSVVDAVRCAVEIQEELRVRNAELPENRKMEFCIGINLGDVVQEGERIYGDGVNITARVEGLAEGGGICISGTVYDSIKNKLSLSYESLGEHTVKNITEPVRVYRMRVGPEVREKKAGPRRWHKAALAAVVILVVAVGAWAVWNFYLRPPPMEVASVEKMAFPLPEKPSIAVLPFVNMSEDPKQEFFSDGLTEQIIMGLSKVPHLFVIARNSVFTYKNKPVKVQQVSEELGVRYVLEGSVQKAADRVRITVQLIDATTGHHLWSERYDRHLKDIFAVQDEITLKIMKAMRIELTAGEQARMRAERSTENLEAYEKYLQARYYGGRHTKQDNARARQLHKEAISVDPKFALAYAGMGWMHFWDVRYGWSESRARSIKTAFKLAQKALALDDKVDIAHDLLASIHFIKREWEKGISAAERAVALNPNGSASICILGSLLSCSGRWEEGIPFYEKAIRLEPFPPTFYFYFLGRAYMMTERYEEAIGTFKKAIRVSPDYLNAHIGLAATYSLQGGEADARTKAAEVLKIRPKFSLERFAKTLPYENRSDRKFMIEALRKAGLPDKPPLPLPDKPSIAVLPFTNISGDPEQEYFSDGLTEEIITALSKTPKLFVIARNSTFTYKGKPTKVQQVGRELGVKYVLEGSVRKAGDKVRITAQLVDALTGKHLWAERYERELKDIFALQDEITMKIITAMQVKLTDGEQARLWARGTDNLEAYLKFLQGREHASRFNKEDNIFGRRLAEEAIALDPEYGDAYKLLGATHHMDVWLQTTKSPKQSIRKAMDLVQKAIVLDPSNAEAHAHMGFLFTMISQHEKAIAEGEKAVAHNPNSAQAHFYLSMALRWGGRPEQAIPVAKKSIRLDPFAQSNYLYNLGLAYLFTGQYEEAIRECKKAADREPNNLGAHLALAGAYGLAGHEEEARAETGEVLRIDPNFSLELFSRRLTYKNKADKEFFIGAMRKAGLK